MRAVRLLGPAVMIISSLALCELVLRIVPSPVAYRPIHEFDDPQSLLGIELSPRTTHHLNAPCFTSTITTNSWGWRDSEWSKEKPQNKIRIAVLGDSFMEGLHVNDEEVFAQRLEHYLGPTAEVLNFGISTVGTVQEEILFSAVVREFKPDIVLLAAYRNDIVNNHPALDGAGGTSRLTFRTDTGELTHQRTAHSFFGVRKWLRQHSALFRFAKFAYGTLHRNTSPATNSGSTALPTEFTVYTEPTGVWVEAWDNTSDALQRLAAEVKPGKLYTFWIPDTMEIAHDPSALLREHLQTDPPAGFDVQLPQRRFEAIAAAQTIPTIDVRAAFLAERDAKGLTYPYFARTCENHWSPLGHDIAAKTVADFLLLQWDTAN